MLLLALFIACVSEEGTTADISAPQLEYTVSGYYLNVEQAYTLGRKKDIEQARCALDRAFSLAKPLPGHLWFAAHLSDLADDPAAVERYLVESAANGYSPSKLQERFEVLTKTGNTTTRNAVEAAYQAWFSRRADHVTTQLINETYAVDQFVRRHIFKPNKTKDWAKAQLLRTDSLNLNALMTHIEANGFPDRFEIDDATHRNLFVMLLHQTTDIEEPRFQKVDSLLRQQVHLGNLAPLQYAQINDRRRLWGQEAPVLYGTYNLTADRTLPAIEDVERLDKRRADIGLGPYVYFEEARERKLFDGYQPTVEFPHVKCFQK